MCSVTFSMKCRNIVLFSLIALGFIFGSCTPDVVYSYPPEYEKPLLFTLDAPSTITLSNQSNVSTTKYCNVGDSVTVFLPVTYTGSYITKATYSWTSDSEKLGSETIVQIAPHKQMTPPMWRFVAPDSAGTYKVFFRASYSYSAQTEDGAIFGEYPSGSGAHGYQDGSSVYGELVVR